MKMRVLLILIFLFMAIYQTAWCLLKYQLFNPAVSFLLGLVGLVGLIVTFVIFYKRYIKVK